MKKIFRCTVYWGGLIILLFGCGILAEPFAEDRTARYERVLNLAPVGYWPLDEGSGTLLQDLSGNTNHGHSFNVHWKDGLLDFTSGFQWLEIPSSAISRKTDAFSLGAWYFTRRDDYLGGSDLRGPKHHETDGHHTQGACLINNAYGAKGGWVKWDSGMRTMKKGVGLRLRSSGSNPYDEGALLGVVHGNRGDVIDSAVRGLAMQAGKWQHILYSYENGTGSLFIDGQLMQRKSSVPYQPSDKPFLIGNDMSWWMVYPIGSQSLHGSVRDVVFFDRALSEQEADLLCTQTVPPMKPQVFTSATPVVDGRMFPFGTLAVAAVEDRLRVLEMLADRETVDLRAHEEVLMPVLNVSLNDWQTRRAATALLMKLDSATGWSLMKKARSQFIAVVKDSGRPEQDRAGAALGLSEMGSQAKEAIPVLVKALNNLIEHNVIRLPKIEELLRNSLTRALLDIDPENEQAREILAKTLAKPFFEMANLEGGIFAEVRSGIEEGRYIEALKLYLALPLKDRDDRFFTQGDPYRDRRGNLKPNDRAYSPVVSRDGFQYQVGSEIPWESGEKVSKEQYLEAINDLPEQYREAAKSWEYAGSSELKRVRLYKIGPDGKRVSSLLEGGWFIFDAHDKKMTGWTIDIDSDGYLHLTGGMHNAPRPDFYAPGVWEKMGLERKGGRAPGNMYWVSKRPHDIREFEFVGHKDNPRNLPVDGLNYMNFIRDQDDKMFLYGRITTQYIQSWGMFRYDARRRRWLTLGGDARDVVKNAREAHNEALFLLRDGTPWQPGPFNPKQKAIAWGWQPQFYNFIRGWGARFDPTGRLHVRMNLHALGADSRILDSEAYAWSDDLGQTFQRADGSPLSLPLTINPAPTHNADIYADFMWQRWTLWLSLLMELGYYMQDSDSLKF